MFTLQTVLTLWLDSLRHVSNWVEEVVTRHVSRLSYSFVGLGCRLQRDFSRLARGAAKRELRELLRSVPRENGTKRHCRFLPYVSSGDCRKKTRTRSLKLFGAEIVGGRAGIFLTTLLTNAE